MSSLLIPMRRNNNWHKAHNLRLLKTLWNTLSGLILCLHPANERRHYKVMPSHIGWVKTWNHPCVLFQSRQQWYHAQFHQTRIVIFYCMASSNTSWYCLASGIPNRGPLVQPHDSSHTTSDYGPIALGNKYLHRDNNILFTVALRAIWNQFFLFSFL